MDSHQQCKRISLSLHPRQHLLFPELLIFTILTGVSWYLIVVLISISLMMSDVEQFFMSVSHLHVFFEKLLINVFCSFLYCLFFELSLISSLWILGSNPLSDMPFVSIFSHSVGCLLVLMIVFVAVQKLFILMKFHWFIFAFISLVSRHVSSKKWLQLRSKWLLPVFSRILMVSLSYV